MTDDAETRAQAARETCPYLTAKQTAFHLGIPPHALRADFPMMTISQIPPGARCRIKSMVTANVTVGTAFSAN